MIMETLKMSKRFSLKILTDNRLLLGLLVLLWLILQQMMRKDDPVFGFIDPNIWLLILLSVICFFGLTCLCWRLLQDFWMSLGLSLTGDMVLQFKNMESWQQLGFYWLSFVSLLLAAVGCLIAIC